MQRAKGSWPSLLSFQREQIGEHVGNFFVGELALVGRHRRRRRDRELAQLALRERMQALAVVDDLHAVGVLVEPAAIDDSAVLGDEADRSIDRHHLAGWLEERALKGSGAASRADVTEMGSDARSHLSDAVTGGAAPLVSQGRPRE